MTESHPIDHERWETQKQKHISHSWFSTTKGNAHEAENEAEKNVVMQMGELISHSFRNKLHLEQQNPWCS